MVATSTNIRKHTIAEVELIYKSTVKPSQRPKVTSSRHAYEVLLENWDAGKIEFVEQFKILLMNNANRVLGMYEVSTGGVAGTIAERKEIEEKLMTLSRQVSNLDDSIGFVIKFALELPLKWVSADYNTKQRIQFLLFPQGIRYSKKTDESRTQRINLLFLYIAYFQQIITKKKRGIPELGLNFASFSTLVEGTLQMSNFLEDYEAVLNTKNLIE